MASVHEPRRFSQSSPTQKLLVARHPPRDSSIVAKSPAPSVTGKRWGLDWFTSMVKRDKEILSLKFDDSGSRFVSPSVGFESKISQVKSGYSRVESELIWRFV